MVAESRERILRLRAPYRVAEALEIELLEDTTGRLKVELLGYVGHFPTRILFSEALDYDGPATLHYLPREGTIRWGEIRLATLPIPSGARRFCWDFRLSHSGLERQRRTSHYLVSREETIGQDYYEGGNYVDHAAEAAGETEKILELLKAYDAVGPALEIGCATGGVLRALSERGVEAYGFDISEWAVAQANELLGPGRAFHCDVDLDPLPTALASKAPFQTLILWAVFEHFREPFRVLEKISQWMAPGSVLLLNTTNADSLSHRVFGEDWEGYFDGSHHGVDRVSVESVRQGLSDLGWRIEQLDTHLIWDTSADPLHSTFREWWSADARFRQVLAEKDLGDLLVCVATKT